jgi:hypothetical protein
VLRRVFQRWRTRAAHLRDLEQHVQAIADTKCQRRALDVWRGARQQRAQERWRAEMREKMKIVRSEREAKLRKDAWAKWRQLYRSHISQQHYSAHLVLRTFGAWRARLAKLDELDAMVERFEERGALGALRRAWETWKSAKELRAKEAVVAHRVGLRIKRRALLAWKQKMCVVRPSFDYLRLTYSIGRASSWLILFMTSISSSALWQNGKRPGIVSRCVSRPCSTVWCSSCAGIGEARGQARRAVRRNFADCGHSHLARKRARSAPRSCPDPASRQAGLASLETTPGKKPCARRCVRSCHLAVNEILIASSSQSSRLRVMLEVSSGRR